MLTKFNHIFDIFFLSFEQSLYASISKVSYPSSDLSKRRFTSSCISEENALNFPVNIDAGSYFQ